jgi:hypothetical protein
VLTRRDLGTFAVLLLAIGCDAGAPRIRGRGGAHESPPPSVSEVPQRPTGEPSRDGWNTAQIEWRPYDEGLAEARRTARPVLLALSATWCGHCRTYSHVFEDPRVVLRARRFVMVRIDSDQQRDVAARYALDGTYVPRTYFLSPDGAPMADVQAAHPRFHYFFDESDPSSLVAGMDAALARAGG